MSAWVGSISAPRPADAWRRTPWPGLAWTALLTAVVLAPILAPGYVLNNDMVFTPHQTLLPWNLGIGGGLPRSVPEDVLVSLVSGPIPGQVLQKLVLLLIFVLAGTGVDRLLRSRTLLVRLVAITLVLWNPYVAERLIQGHWALLLAYAVLPWVLRAARDARNGQRGAVPRLVLWCALGSLVPSGGLLLCAVVVGPLLLPKGGVRKWPRFGAVAVLVAINAMWWLPSILSSSADRSDPLGATGFALTAEGWPGSIVTALGLGGIWNTDAIPATRSLPWIPIVTVLLGVLAIVGFVPLTRLLGRATASWLAVVAAVGFTVAVAGSLSTTAAPVRWLVTDIPGGGLLRDGQKLLAPLALVIALAAPLGLNRLLARLSSVDTRRMALLLLLLAPLLALPDLAWGAFGRLQPVAYPASWHEVREVIAGGPSGDAISLPWAAFRRYAWNGNRTVLDPAPRFMTRTVLTDRRLPIQLRNGIGYVTGDDPRSAAVEDALYSGRPLRDTLPRLGVRWVIDQTDQPPVDYHNSLLGPLDHGAGQQRLFAGLVKAYSGEGLTLWRTPTPAETVSLPAWSWLVILVDVFGGALILVMLGVGLTHRISARRQLTQVRVGSNPR